MTRLLTAFLLTAAACLAIAPMLALAQAEPHSTAAQDAAKKAFRAYLASDWKHWMAEYPEFATATGFPGQNDRWTDDSPAGIAARVKHLHDSLARLQSFSRAALPPAEQLNYDLYLGLLQTAVEGLQYGDDPMPFRNVVPHNLYLPISQMEGIQQGAADTIASSPHRNPADFEAILKRMIALPAAVDQQIALLQEGLKKGYTQPKITMRDVPQQISDLIPGDPMESALLQPFKDFPADFPASQKPHFIESAQKIFFSADAPAFQRLRDYLVKIYIPACRESIAATALPNGEEAYAFHVRWHTTTNLTPQQIHETGLSEVRRIRAEMDKVIASTGFKGSFHDFTEFLRTDPRFYFDKAGDLVDGYKVIAKSIDPQLVHEFGKLPRNRYGVLPVPDFKAPSQTTAYYQPGAPATGRAGYYFVNTYNLHARPKWEMEALTLHEAVPGHHLQISLAQEDTEAPAFRRNVGYSAFVEGWALYSESLGKELGLYKDPYSRFGQLTYEMWRAIRLVVDTGMHSMGWTRDQAIQFFKDNTGKTDQDITVEVDRYIVWPGQALAYKIGQMKFRELRSQAEKKLGAGFDVRKFHDTVLEEGAVPLDELQKHFESWLTAQEGH